MSAEDFMERLKSFLPKVRVDFTEESETSLQMIGKNFSKTCCKTNYKLLITEIDLGSRIDGFAVAKRAKQILKLKEMQESHAVMNKRFTEKRDLSLMVVGYSDDPYTHKSDYI